RLRSFRVIDEPPVAMLRDEIAATVAAAHRIYFGRRGRSGLEQQLAIVDLVELPGIGKFLVRPQSAQDVDEFDGAAIALLALQHGSAEHAKFLVEPAIDDIDRHAARTNAVKRDRELANHDRIPQTWMHGDKCADALEQRTDC